MLTVQQSHELLAKHGCYVTEACDKCGQLLGPVRYTRKGEEGMWCSRECRGIVEQPATRKGGRPRKYKDERTRKIAHAQQQRDFRLRSSVTKTPSNLYGNTRLTGVEKGSLALPLIRPTSAQETPRNENGGARV